MRREEGRGDEKGRGEERGNQLHIVKRWAKEWACKTVHG